VSEAVVWTLLLINAGSNNQEVRPMTMTTAHVPFPERDPEELLTLSEVAEILRVPVNTMRWWRQRGVGPEFFKIGRHLVTTVGDVRRFIREQRRGQRGAL
jgi:hypothetical protein